MSSADTSLELEQQYFNLMSFLFPAAFQEEEIPELEIDIDELLELTDEGQRTRLQVSSC